MCQIGVAPVHRRNQRIDNLIVHIICLIARCHRPVKTTPAIFNLFILGNRVEGQRQ